MMSPIKIKANTERLNNIALLSQPTPPTSGRTYLNVNLNGGSTTRRSLNKNIHGNYEGDLTMFQNAIKDICLSHESLQQQQQQLQPSLVDQILDGSLDLGLEQQLDSPKPIENTIDDDDDDDDDEVDEIVEAEIRAEQFKLQEELEKRNALPSYWELYKHKIFNPEKCKQIDDAIMALRKNSVYRKVSYGVRYIVVIGVWLLRLLLFSSIVHLYNMSCTALRSRNVLRGAARRMLWWMTLAKCGDLQLFGLIVILSPLVFLAGSLGFLFALYSAIRDGTTTFISNVRFRLDIEPPRFE